MYKNLPPLPMEEENHSAYLQDLGFQCATLEEELRSVAETLTVTQRAVIEDYIAFRNILELESIQAAIRYGERRAKKNTERKK